MNTKILATSDDWTTLATLIRSGATYPKTEHICYEIGGTAEIKRKVWNYITK